MVTAWPCFYEQLPSGCAEEMFRLAIELLQLCNYPLAIKAILLDIKQDERGKAPLTFTENYMYGTEN